MRIERGFTLVELMIVIAIVGILAAIAIPQFGAYRAKAYNASVESQIRHVAAFQEAYFVENNTYTTDTNDLDGYVNDPQVTITITTGDTGDIGTSYSVTGAYSMGSLTYTLFCPGGQITGS